MSDVNEIPNGNNPLIEPDGTTARPNTLQEEAAELREKEARENERKRNLIILGAVAIVAIVLAVIFFWVLPEDNESPDNPVTVPTQQETAEPEDELLPDPTGAPTGVPEEPTDEETLPVDPGTETDDVSALTPDNTQEDGGVSIGSALTAGTVNEGAGVMEVYFDFSCQYCQQFENTHADDIRQLLTDGEITVVYRNIAMMDTTEDLSDFSGEASNAVATVAHLAPESYLDMMNEIFANERQEQGTPLAEVEQYALNAGVPQEVVDQFSDGLFKEWVISNTYSFFEEGFQGTPTIIIDGQEFTDWVDEGSVAEAVTTVSPS